MIELEGESTASAEPADGRAARRARNVNAVLDVVLELFAEESLFPTIEQAATRSGLSLRSLYRYFADPGELLEATIRRSRERVEAVSQIPDIGTGPLSERIRNFVDARLRLYEDVGPVFRATVANAARLPQVSDELAATRSEFHTQFLAQFAPELDGQPAHSESAGDLITQMDSIDYLRRVRELTVDETAAVLVSTLESVFEAMNID